MVHPFLSPEILSAAFDVLSNCVEYCHLHNLGCRAGINPDGNCAEFDLVGAPRLRLNHVLTNFYLEGASVDEIQTWGDILMEAIKDKYSAYRLIRAAVMECDLNTLNSR